MIVSGHNIQVPWIGLKLSTGAPVFQKNIIPCTGKHVEQVDFIRRIENIGAYTGSMHQHYRSPVFRSIML